MSLDRDLFAAQADMRHAYCGGGAGVLASAMAWTCAAAVVFLGSATSGMWTLLFGGMAIHPVGMLIARLMGRPGNHTKGNPLAVLAGASTFWLIFSLPLAYVASLQHREWFFPAMLLVIGGRYLVFHTLYGMRIYWVCGLSLAAAGYLLGAALAQPLLGAVAGAAIEIVFGIAIMLLDRRAVQPEASKTLRRAA